MTVLEIIQRIQSLYSKGIQSDDTRLSKRHIYNKLNSTKNYLVNRKLLRGQPLSIYFYQSLDIDVIKASIFEDSCYLPVNCNISRSRCKIPKITHFRNSSLIKNVISLDGNIKLNYTVFEELGHLSGNKYTKNNMWYFMKDGYFYFVHSKKIKKIRITAMFSDPIAIAGYTCGNKTECIDPLNSEYPIADDLIDQVVLNSVKELISVFSQMREDLTNDNKDDIIQNSK